MSEIERRFTAAELRPRTDGLRTRDERNVYQPHQLDNRYSFNRLSEEGERYRRTTLSVSFKVHVALVATTRSITSILTLRKYPVTRQCVNCAANKLLTMLPMRPRHEYNLDALRMIRLPLTNKGFPHDFSTNATCGKCNQTSRCNWLMDISVTSRIG